MYILSIKIKGLINELSFETSQSNGSYCLFKLKITKENKANFLFY